MKFRRIRHRGILAGRAKKKSLAVIRAQLGVTVPEGDSAKPAASGKPEAVADSFSGDDDSSSGDLPELKPPRCRKCGEEMVWKCEVEPLAWWIRKRYSHFALRVRGAGFGVPGGSSRPRAP